MPAGQSVRAIDSARLRWAALAGANAAVFTLPRRDAVAPMNTMLPRPAAFIVAITCLDARNAPSVFTRHDCSKSAALTSSMLPHTPLPALYTNVSIGPSSAAMAVKARATEPASLTSHS
jgi:hypothetical protein